MNDEDRLVPGEVDYNSIGIDYEPISEQISCPNLVIDGVDSDGPHFECSYENPSQFKVIMNFGG